LCIRDTIAGAGDGIHILASTDPDTAILAEKRASSGKRTIRILSPSLDDLDRTGDEVIDFQPDGPATRGMMTLAAPEVEVMGRIDWTAPALIVLVNQQRATLSPDGSFRHSLKLTHGVTNVTVNAWTHDNVQHTTTFQVEYKSEEQKLLGDGTRYAVLIANQNYGPETGMSTLSTPFADIDALERVLSETYGFTTSAIDAAGKPISLVRRDATEKDITRILHKISRIAGVDDTVLIYYAGHGAYESLTGNAYWVPVKSEAGFWDDYIKTSDVSDALRRIESNNVLLIADSCYSGGHRGGADLEPARPAQRGDTPEQRLTRYARMVGKRSRELISSGNLEVVLDGGGDGHSVFARALLNGLRNIDADYFSASELWGRIHQEVFSNAEQEPQHIPLRSAGHEGGGFVFARAD